MAVEYFLAYHSLLESLEPYNDAERGRLFTALLQYSATGAVPHLSGNERYVFPTLKAQIDRDVESYNAKCEKNSKNGKLGGRPPKSERLSEKPNGFFENPTKAKKAKEKEKEKEKTKEKENTKESVSPPISPSRGSTRFVPPTLDEVDAYCSERGNGISAQSFIDYYSARGWKLGKESMKDWKAAVRTWENRRRSDESTAERGSNVFLEMYNERRMANDI